MSDQAGICRASLGFEKNLWDMADQMRGHMDPAEYKHVVLGLIFLKYISDTFQELHGDLAARAAVTTCIQHLLPIS